MLVVLFDMVHHGGSFGAKVRAHFVEAFLASLAASVSLLVSTFEALIAKCVFASF
jgi:hypothetical protein